MSPRKKEKNQAQKPSVLGNLMTTCVILFSNLKSLKSGTYKLLPGTPRTGFKIWDCTGKFGIGGSP